MGVASSKLVGAVIATSVTTITTILRLWSICLAFSSVTVWMHVDAWLLWWGDTDLDEATATEQGPLQCSDTEVALGTFKVGDMYSKFGARSRGLGFELLASHCDHCLLSESCFQFGRHRGYQSRRSRSIVSRVRPSDAFVTCW